VKYIAAVALFPFPFRQWLLLGTLRVACLFMLSQKQQLSWLLCGCGWGLCQQQKHIAHHRVCSKDEEKILFHPLGLIQLFTRADKVEHADALLRYKAALSLALCWRNIYISTAPFPRYDNGLMVSTLHSILFIRAPFPSRRYKIERSCGTVTNSNIKHLSPQHSLPTSIVWMRILWLLLAHFSLDERSVSLLYICGVDPTAQHALHFFSL
jgi:hypothetical protein